jgi:hypothetical protein
LLQKKLYFRFFLNKNHPSNSMHISQFSIHNGCCFSSVSLQKTYILDFSHRKIILHCDL